MSFTSGYPAVGLGLPWTVNDSSPQQTTGQRIQAEDGSEYIYVGVGAADTVAGKLYQSPAEVTGNENLAVAAAAIGATSITTTTTVTVTANQYAGGFVVVSITPGVGTKYRIANHPAVTSAALTLTLEDPLLVAFTTATRVDLVADPYANVIVQSVGGSFTGAPVGFAVAPITAGNYGWLQTKGVCAAINDANGAITVGQDLAASSSVAGSVRLATAGLPSVAIALEGIATSETGAVLAKL